MSDRRQGCSGRSHRWRCPPLEPLSRSTRQFARAGAAPAHVPRQQRCPGLGKLRTVVGHCVL
jgi:hypothetical protein